MNIYVCVKQVPDTEARIVVKNGKQIDEVGMKWILNPYDEFAVEEALKVKEAGNADAVIAVSLGPDRAKDALRMALAMGADRALHLVTDEPIASRQTATALAAAIRADGEVSLIFTGTVAIDDYAGQVHVRLAHQLTASVATNVTAFSMGVNSVDVTREVGGGAQEKLSLTMPAVVAVTKGINTPRYPKLPNIMKAKKKEIKPLTLAAVGIDEISQAWRIDSLSAPEEFSGGEILTGDNASTVPELVQRLRNEAKVF